jgi:hypothetical protein
MTAHRDAQPGLATEILRLRAGLLEVAQVDLADVPAHLTGLFLTIADGGKTAEHVSLEEEHDWLLRHLDKVAQISSDDLPEADQWIIERARDLHASGVE